jgi:hypothetical protein
MCDLQCEIRDGPPKKLASYISYPTSAIRNLISHIPYLISHSTYPSLHQLWVEIGGEFLHSFN